MGKYAKYIFLMAASLMLLVSCKQNESPMALRAQKQIPVSLPRELETLGVGAKDWRIEDMKTVYANDTIALVQFTARFHDAAGEKMVRDYRYIYILDIPHSYAQHRTIYTEEFRNVLCMPDELIEKCRKQVEANGESVYDQFYGGGMEVAEPFDAK